jgi:hypothetical protein
LQFDKWHYCISVPWGKERERRFQNGLQITSEMKKCKFPAKTNHANRVVTKRRKDKASPHSHAILGVAQINVER